MARAAKIGSNWILPCQTCPEMQLECRPDEITIGPCDLYTFLIALEGAIQQINPHTFKGPSGVLIPGLVVS